MRLVLICSCYHEFDVLLCTRNAHVPFRIPLRVPSRALVRVPLGLPIRVRGAGNRERVYPKRYPKRIPDTRSGKSGASTRSGNPERYPERAPKRAPGAGTWSGYPRRVPEVGTRSGHSFRVCRPYPNRVPAPDLYRFGYPSSFAVSLSVEPSACIGQLHAAPVQAHTTISSLKLACDASYIGPTKTYVHYSVRRELFYDIAQNR